MEATPIATAGPAPSSKALAVVPKKKLGLIARFFAWLGFVRAPASVMAGDPPGMSRIEIAGSLVRRARNGDQNAMALIDIARTNAASGVTQSKLMLTAILDYIKRNPVPGTAVDGDARDYASAVQIANGPILDNSRITAALSMSPFGADLEAFGYGVRNAANLPNGTVSHPAVQAGKIVGLAQRLQAVRRPTASVTDYDPVIGWELGEREVRR